MSSLLHRRSWGRSNDIAFVLCVVEVIAILGGALIKVFVKQPIILTRLSAPMWLACGLGSLAYSIAGLTAGSNRRASVWMVLVSSALFFLCGFRFALV
jgi:hypothetical protein